MLAIICLATIAVLAVAYFYYGDYLKREFHISDMRKTPAQEMNDGVDYVPTKPVFLLGQHFSAIAAAGPIVGPILAGLTFGWVPALAWIVIGSIFLGGLHDFAALVASIRHKARSIAEIVKEHMSRRAYFLFLGFVWLALVNVIIAFTDITAKAFINPMGGGGVASSSILYLAAGVVMGVCMQKFKMKLSTATAIFVPLIFVIIWAGRYIPLALPVTLDENTQKIIWQALLLGYCFIASIIPVWALLQPRGYLGGYFLFITLAAGLAGVLVGGITGGLQVQYPAFTSWRGRPETGLTELTGLMFPVLFITVACGACSGFHAIVSSGTTSKQLEKESDAVPVGYGGMLLEAVVALISLATIMILSSDSELIGGPNFAAGSKVSADTIYAVGMSRIISQWGGWFGIGAEFLRSFALMALATFVYDTLDVCTRLGRYVFQELTGWEGKTGRAVSTLITIAVAALCLVIPVRDPVTGSLVPAWPVFWKMFGTSNQLLAALTLMAIAVWMRQMGRNWKLAAAPAVFMLAVTITSLILTLRPWVRAMMQGSVGIDLRNLIGLVLLGLSVVLIVEAIQIFTQKSSTRTI